MSNDVKWLECEMELDFVPDAGLNIEGLAGGDMPLKVSSVTYEVAKKVVHAKLAWLSIDPLSAQQLLDLNVGWRMRTEI